MNTANFQCPICHETLLDPRSLNCGHNYCGQINGLAKPCIDYLLRDGVIICAMDNKKFPKLKLSDIRTNTTLRDTIEDYKRSRRSKCPTHLDNNLDVVCLTCDDKMICTSCMKDHRGHDMTSAADHYKEMMAEIDNELDEKTRGLEEKLANRDKALEKLTRLTEDVRHDREEISRSFEKLRSLKLQSQQIRERNPSGTLYRAEEVGTFLKKDRSVDLKNAVQPEIVQATCREVIQILTDGQPSPKSNINVTPGNEALQRGAEHSSAVSKAATRSPVTNFASAREVARVKQVECWSISCVNDSIFATTEDPNHVIKYLWNESGGKISIKQMKRSDKIESSNIIRIAAVKAFDGVRLYVCHNPGGKCSLDRFEPDSLKHLKKIRTDKLNCNDWWPIAAWNDMIAVSDDHVIAMYKNDQLVSTVPSKHGVWDIRLSSTFLATRNVDFRIRVMRWSGDGLDTTPVYTVERRCEGVAMSERLLVTRDYDRKKLVTLDLTTGDERLPEGDVGWFYPYAFAREDLVVGRDWRTLELAMVRLS